MTLKQLVARVLREPVEKIVDEAGPETLPGWDSFNHIQLMVALEETFKVKLSTAEMDRMKTFAAVREVMRGKGIEA
jgi:acyl carrier protein